MSVTLLKNLFEKAAAADYVGEPLRQSEHALQAAALASGSGDGELVLAALFHDVGHLCFPDAEKMANIGVLNHESLGADYLTALGFSRRVASLVAGHVDAKRYLVSTRQTYRDKLSVASQQTLAYQGGPMSKEEATSFEARAEFNDLLKLRAWDEAAKHPNKQVPGFDHYVPMIEQQLAEQKLSNAQIEQFESLGYLHLREVFTPAQIQGLRARVAHLGELPETPGKWMKYFEGSAENERLLCRIENFAQFEDVLGGLIAGPRFLGWVSQLMDQPACLFKEKINFKLPGGAGFLPHQDAPAFTTFGHEYHITLMLSFDDASVENGCLEVAPGQWPNENLAFNPDLTIADEEVEKMDWQTLPTKAGDIVMFGSYLPHRSGPNKTNQPRRALYATYNRAADGNVRDQYFAKKRQTFPPDIERIAGKDYGDPGVFNVGNPVR